VPYLVRTIGNLDPWSLGQKRWRKRLFWHLGVKQMLRGAAAIHYTSQAEQQLAESTLGLQRGIVIPLGVDEELLQPASTQNPFLAQHPTLRESPYVLTLCRLHPKKNLETLIERFLRLTEQAALNHWKLVIAGEGEPGYVEQLLRQVKATSNEQRVLFAGWLQGEEKRGALRAAGLFALLSHQENFGLSVVEAMACGVPVLISTGVNLADEVTAAGAGWVVSLDPQQIETALHTALTEAAERSVRGQAARELVRQRYRWSAVGEQLARLYADICGQRV
jgi:glycosyltransferase involved in cell wall biosynthesis